MSSLRSIPATEEVKTTHLKRGNLVKLREGARQQRTHRCWNSITRDYSYRNHVNLPDVYPADDQWATDYSVEISIADIGVYIERVLPDGKRQRPIDVILINERLVGIEARKIRSRGWPRTVRYESKIKRVTKRDYGPEAVGIV